MSIYQTKGNFILFNFYIGIPLRISLELRNVLESGYALRYKRGDRTFGIHIKDFFLSVMRLKPGKKVDDGSC